MENLDSTKNIILNEIEEEINILLEKLINTDKRSEEYKTLSNDKKLLDLEFNKLETLNSIDTLTSISKKYNFIEIDKIESIIFILKNYKKTQQELKEQIFSKTDYLDSIKDYKEKLLLNEININNIDAKTIEKMIEILEIKFQEYDNTVKKLNAILKNFTFYNYELLKSDVKNNKKILVQSLNEFKNLGVDNLIDRVIELKQEMRKEKSNKLTSKAKQEIEDKYQEKINRYLISIITGIETHIKNSFINYNETLKLDIKVYGSEFLEFYKNLLLEKTPR